MAVLSNQILFSNKLNNIEILRTLTKFGVNTINYRIINY